MGGGRTFGYDALFVCGGVCCPVGSCLGEAERPACWGRRAASVCAAVVDRVVWSVLFFQWSPGIARHLGSQTDLFGGAVFALLCASGVLSARHFHLEALVGRLDREGLILFSMNTSDIRKAYLNFFSARGHVVIPSASLVPENDPTTLFTGSGMQPMVPYLLGDTHPQGTRLADSQKCFRSQDIEEVGDNRHTTFFEMLGNWSLGDYFKKEQIPWMFEFLVKVIGVDPSKLYVTCFIGDEAFNIPKDTEAGELWREQFASVGIAANAADIGSEANGYVRGMKDGERIFYYEGKKNWWNRGKTGPLTTAVGDPCGPDSEMFYDFGTPHDPKWGEHCHPNCDCGRFMEIGNNVFMAYKKADEKTFTPLAAPNIDHGSGLERFVAASNNCADVFLIDVFTGATQAIASVTHKTYGADAEETFAFRVILDHLRAATFLIADGVLPANKDQGYFVRRLVRRAVRFGRKLGALQAFTADVAAAFVDTYAEAYPQLMHKRETICDELSREEAKFLKTLDQGLRELKKIVERTGTCTGKDAFDLYQSYGFPLELTAEELLRTHGLTVDADAFAQEFKKHQDLSRAGSEQKFAGGLADHSVETTRLHTATHLLHKALRDVLGAHVEQKGSNITAERLRFDFSHPEKMTSEQIVEVERLVNNAIARDLPVHFELLSVAEAKSRGAIGLFEDKYAALGDKIKVYFVGDFSNEICGGPHVAHTGELGPFKIVKEEAVSAGIRRIKATLGN